MAFEASVEVSIGVMTVPFVPKVLSGLPTCEEENKNESDKNDTSKNFSVIIFLVEMIMVS